MRGATCVTVAGLLQAVSLLQCCSVGSSHCTQTSPLLQEFNAKLDPGKDVRHSPKAMAKLRKQASTAKRRGHGEACMFGCGRARGLVAHMRRRCALHPAAPPG